LTIGKAVSTAGLFQPYAFHAANGTILDAEPSLMSEVRGPGGLLFASGIIVLLGAVRKELSRLGLMLSALVYGTFGVSRQEKLSEWTIGTRLEAQSAFEPFP
jgi:hypothetical protein